MESTQKIHPIYSFLSQDENLQGAPSTQPEILQRIFSYLKPEELANPILVNSLWQVNVIAQFKTEQTRLIKNLVTTILDVSRGGDQNKIVMINCLSILANPIILNSENLCEIQSSLKIFKENVVSIIPNLSSTELKKLVEFMAEQEIPAGLTSLFSISLNLIRIYKKFDAANAKKNEIKKSWALKKVSISLVNINCIDKAIEVAISITENLIKSKTLCKIVKFYLNNLEFHQALNLAKRIPNKSKKLDIRLKIMEFLLKNGDYEIAIELADSMRKWRSYVLFEIARALSKKKKFDKAIEVADSIPKGEFYRAPAFSEIKEALEHNGNYERASQLADKISADRRNKKNKKQKHLKSKSRCIIN